MTWNAKSLNQLSETVIGAAMEVHRELGPGLLESTYQRCLAHELDLRGIPFVREAPQLIRYKGQQLDEGYRLDFLVQNVLILELKAVEKVLDIYRAQVMTYLKHRRLWLGLLINFNVPILKNGIVRIVNGDPPTGQALR